MVKAVVEPNLAVRGIFKSNYFPKWAIHYYVLSIFRDRVLYGPIYIWKIHYNGWSEMIFVRYMSEPHQKIKFHILLSSNNLSYMKNRIAKKILQRFDEKKCRRK